jgi:galactokinase
MGFPSQQHEGGIVVSAADLFISTFDRPPTGVWSAPGRVNLMGEHTDYNGGYVLPFAINLRTYAAASRRDDERVSVQSLQRPEEFIELPLDELTPGIGVGVAVAGVEGVGGGWASYALGVLWALRGAGHRIGGLDIVLDGQVPSGAGLSSSAAMECAVGLAAAELSELEIPLAELARIAQYAENNFVGVPCGLMDQMAACVCQADRALFFDVRDDVTEHEPFAPHDDGLAVVVIDTRAHHAHAGGGYAERRRACEEAARQLGVSYLRDIPGSGLDSAMAALDDDVLRRRARHIITENDRVLTTVDCLASGRLADIGPILTQSHASMRDDFEISVPELDTAVDASLAAGALGARMTGGGFGGSAIALIRASDLVGVSHAVESAFELNGFTAPQIWSPRASAGASRDS